MSNSITQSDRLSTHSDWYRPTFSPQHGVYVVLLVSFLTGAAAAQQWNFATTLALICAFAAFQAEHPLAMQIKQRRSWKPRLLVWTAIYGGLSLGIGIYLAILAPALWWVYLGAIAALVIDAISVLWRQQKSIPNEMLTFAAVCLAAPFACIATKGDGNVSILAVWLLNWLYFSSSIFTVKFRKVRTSSPIAAIVYHAIAALAVLGLWYAGEISAIALASFSIVILKFCLILWQLDWYRKTEIKYVAVLETLTAIAFFLGASISLLPEHLPPAF